MNKVQSLAELYCQMEERRKVRAKRPIAEKLAAAERLRNLQKALAPLRVANKASRAAGKAQIQIKTK